MAPKDATLRSFDAGVRLFNDGDRGELMYVIRKGRVRIFTEVGDMSKQLAILGPGDFFGELALLNNKPRTASAEALEPLEVLAIGRNTLRDMVSGNAEIAVRLIQRLASRLDSANELIDLLMHEDKEARVILGIAHAAEFDSEEREDGSVFVASTHEQLATHIAVEERVVREVVKRLTRLGVVEEASDGFVVPNRLRLHEFLEFMQSMER